MTELPAEVLALDDTLEVLDVSGNAMSTLPEGLARFSRLHTVFASSNQFVSLPSVLGRLPMLDTLGFKGNRIVDVPPHALAPTLRWLILTDNRISVMPTTLTGCARMQKLMLAGNRLERLPSSMGRLRRLELIRLAANRFERVEDALPDELLALPRLAWLGHAGNPFSVARERAARAAASARAIPSAELHVRALLGEGASGQIYAATWQPPGGPGQEAALKLFKGAVTSDGLPQSEMTATLVAGVHPNLVGVLGVLDGHPQGAEGLVLPLLPSSWKPLAGPPSMVSCSRDVYGDDIRFDVSKAAAMARGAAGALAHLHERGLTHGDLYAHNLLVDGQGGALLSDFGAASLLPVDDSERRHALRALDRRALQVLVDELAARSDSPDEVNAAI